MNNIAILTVAGGCMALSVASVTARKSDPLDMVRSMASFMEGTAGVLHGVSARIEPYPGPGEGCDCIQWKNTLPVHAQVGYRVAVLDRASNTQATREKSLLLTPGGVFASDFRDRSQGHLVSVRIVRVEKRD